MAGLVERGTDVRAAPLVYCLGFLKEAFGDVRGSWKFLARSLGRMRKIKMRTAATTSAAITNKATMTPPAIAPAELPVFDATKEEEKEEMQKGGRERRQEGGGERDSRREEGDT